MRTFNFALMSILMALMCASCQKRHETDFTVTGNIENVEDDYLILFFKSSPEGAAETIAIDTLKNGRFDFIAPAETGVQYHVMAYSLGVFPSMSVDFYVEPGAKVKITGNDYLTRNWNVKTSSKEQKIYQSYFDEVAELFKELQLLELQCRKEGRSSDYLNLNKPLHAKIDSIQLKWLKSQKRISEPWMDLMLQSVKTAIHYNEKDNLKELQEIWARVDSEKKGTAKGKSITNILYPDGEPLKVGDSFPYNVEAYDLDGNVHSLSEFKDKAMLLYFGSYSCAPCRIAKKELTELVNSGKYPVAVIGFNLDTEVSWKVGSRKNPVPWHDFNDLKGSHGFNKRFETQGIPTFVIVSKEGKILDIWAGHKDGIIAERIESVLL